MDSTVTWGEIEAECGDFRAGFVATFRKYEGQKTDEKDGQNRTVKVTAASFARHMGIAEATFARWAKQNRRGGGPAPESRNRTAEALRDPENRKKAIAELSEEERLEVAQAAMKPVVDRGEQEKRDRRAIREERSEDPTETAYRIIRLDLAKVDDALRSAINVARDSTWPAERTERLLARIEKTEGLLDVLRLAVRNEADVNWDAELANLVAEEESR